MNKTIDLHVTIPDTAAGQRVDQALSDLLAEHSRARIQGWIKSDQVLINGKACKAKDKVNGGETIHIQAELVPNERWEAQAIDLDIIHADDDIIVLNKPAGLVVHPAAGNPDQTLVNALLHHFPELDHLPRAGVIHRLDKDTSGVMVVARSLTAHTHLINALQAREIKREYLALVQGTLTAGGTVDAPIGRHPKQRTRMAVVNGGKPAVTHYRINTRYPHHTLLDVQLETGRTHQIRVHMAHINHPIVGDPVYSGRMRIAKGLDENVRQALQAMPRQCLHACKLTLQHPTTQAHCEFTAAIAKDINALLALLK